MALSALVLASDFPSSENPTLVEWVTRGARRPKVAWSPPNTKTGRARFPSAKRAFERQCGAVLEFCDIDEAPDPRQIAQLAEYDVIHLSGGDPLSFQRNLQRFELRERLLDRLNQGRVVMAASGGAMQFTPNLSLFSLMLLRGRSRRGAFAQSRGGGTGDRGVRASAASEPGHAPWGQSCSSFMAP